MELELTEDEAEDVLIGFALLVKSRQGRSEKWSQRVEETIRLGQRLSRQFEAELGGLPGWFERYLGGTPVVPPFMPAVVLAHYGIPAPVPPSYQP